MGPTRKLPFNRDQNPYEVAERWLEEHGLPPDQKEQVRAPLAAPRSLLWEAR